ncbi:MAG: hypothetical protein GF364_19700 [Candidatus Lokiarchaeota archaeon]|nr:hypothetical protein [Candidatus Lokiarchaeota archaeon]
MTFKERYHKKKAELLDDPDVNPENRKTIKKFLEYEEYKLKRKQGLSEVDERSYKTLESYIRRIRQVNEWLGNKDWNKLKKSDIKKMIDDLEDGVITTHKGTKHSDRAQFYQLIQGKLFDIVKKSQYAKEIFSDFEVKGRDDDHNEVRFIDEGQFRKIVDCAITPIQRCLLWLAFDIGENIGTLLELEKEDFKRQTNPDTGDPEYLVILPKHKLKRSRTPRTEITNYADTVKYLDIVLDDVKPADKNISNKWMKDRPLSEIHSDDKLFKFGMKAATLFLDRAVDKAKVRCQPGGQKVTWKDLRSSMACDCLKKDWSRDEVNSRLGHKPSSRVIDKYINYLALDKRKPQKKIYEGNMKKLQVELDKNKDTNKLQGERIKRQEADIEALKRSLEEMQKYMQTQIAKAKA